jgi:hypothetical protein
MEDEKEIVFEDLEGVEDSEANNFEAEVVEGEEMEKDGECEDVFEE